MMQIIGLIILVIIILCFYYAHNNVLTPPDPPSPQIIIKSNIIYPKEAHKKKLTGKAFVKFIVDETGVIVDPEIAKSSGYEILDEEAKRVIMLMPKWNAGMQNNKYVKVSIMIPFNFSLNN